MSIKPELLHAMLDRALEEEMGIVVSVTNVNTFINMINAYRRANHPVAHKELSVAFSSRPEEVFIIRKAIELDIL